MSSSPDGRKAPPPRLKIQLPLPGQYYPQTGMGYVSTPYGQTPMPMTPVSGQPQMLYANKASEFVFSQFKGIKDLTKSGLSVGEKSAFWLYEKVCVISCVCFSYVNQDRSPLIFTNLCTGQFLEQTMVHAYFLICYRAFVQYWRRDDICHDRGNQRRSGAW